MTAIAKKEEPKRKTRRKRGSSPMVPPVAVPDGVARVAARRAARLSLSERGAVIRFRRLVNAGHSPDIAAEQVSKTAKGLVAEPELAASLSARAGLIGSTAGAHPNPNTVHPTEDLILTLAGAKAGASQVKNGQPNYVKQQLESGKYSNIVANREAVDALEQIGAVAKGQVPSCIDHAGVKSIELSAAETHKTAKDLLVSALQDSAHGDRVFALVTAVKSGATDGAVTFGLNLATQMVDDLLSGRPLEPLSMVGEAAKAGAKATLRTAVVTYSQSITLLRRAKNAFSSRLIRAITSSTLAMSAVADVVVEFAFDVADVLRGKIDEETLFQNLGVNTCGAIGGLAVGGLALMAIRGAPWWLTLLVLGIGLWLGTVFGRRLGSRLFRDESASQSPLIPAT